MFRITLLGLCALVLSSSVGCMSTPRVVRQDADMIIIAVPENTNEFPTYYQDEAAQLASEIAGANVLLSGSMPMKAGQSLASSDIVHRDGSQDQHKTKPSNSTKDEQEYHLIYKVLRPQGGPSSNSNPNNVNIPSFDTGGRTAPPRTGSGDVAPVGWNERSESQPSSRSAPPPAAIGSSTPRLDTPAPATGANDAVPSWNAPRPLPNMTPAP